MKSYLLQILLLFIVFLSVVESQRWAANQQSSNKQANKQPPASSAYGTNSNNGITPQTTIAKAPRSRGIGAWGYVGLILTVILTGLGVYYFIIFYPIVCKKERMYDVMDMSSTV